MLTTHSYLWPESNSSQLRFISMISFNFELLFPNKSLWLINFFASFQSFKTKFLSRILFTMSSRVIWLQSFRVLKCFFFFFAWLLIIDTKTQWNSCWFIFSQSVSSILYSIFRYSSDYQISWNFPKDQIAFSSTEMHL